MRFSTSPNAKDAIARPPLPEVMVGSETHGWRSEGYRRVAVAVELTGADENILAFLRRAQWSPESELVFVHVAESAASRWLGEKSLDSESREDRAALEGLAEEFSTLGKRVSVSWVKCARPVHGGLKSGRHVNSARIRAVGP